MDNKSFFDWGVGYAANNSTNNLKSSSTPASSAFAPGTIPNNPSTTSSLVASFSGPEDASNSRRTSTAFDSHNTAFGGINSAARGTNSAFGDSNAGFGGSDTAFSGGGGTVFGGAGFNSIGDVFSCKRTSFGGSSSDTNNAIGSVGGGGADQSTKLSGDIGTIKIRPSTTTSSASVTSSSVTSSSSVPASAPASAPSSAQYQAVSGGERSSSSSVGETQGSKYNVHDVITNQEGKSLMEY